MTASHQLKLFVVFHLVPVQTLGTGSQTSPSAQYSESCAFLLFSFLPLQPILP